MEAPIIALSNKPEFRRVVSIEAPGLYDTQGRLVAPKKRKVEAQFLRGGAPAWAVEEAKKRFNFSGLGEGEPVEMMIGVFDSAQAARAHKWTEEEHDAVVVELRDTPNPYWFIAEQPKAAAPWPTYDKLTVQGQRNADKVAEQNLGTAEATGISVEAMIAYERQNRNDPRILAAYEAAIVVEVVAEEDLVEA